MVLISFILVFLVLMNLILRKSRSFFFLTIIFMWLLASFTFENADEVVYQSRYETPQLWENNTEYLFMALIKVCRYLGLTFIEYKGVVFAILLFLVGSTIWKLSHYPNVILTMYMFYPFLMHISQIRYALATGVFVFGCRYLVNDNSNRIVFRKISISLNDIKYIVCVIIASLLHSAALLWIIILIAKKMNVKSNIIIAILMNIFIAVSSSISGISSKMFALIGASNRIDAYFSANYQMSEFRHYGSVIPVFIVLIIFVITYMILWRKDHNNIALFGIKLNIIMSVCLSLILKYSSELYRPFEGTLVLNYILLLNLIPNEQFLRVKTRISYFLSEIFAMSAVILFMIFLVKGNIQSILVPVFYNNYLFNYFNA